MIQWQNSSEIQAPKIRACFVGPTRSGKTEICATFPRPLFIFPEIEDSKLTIKGRGFPFVEVGSRTVMEEVLDQLQMWAQTGKLADYCDTVCFDSLTHYAKMVENEIREELERGRGKKVDGRQLYGIFGNHFARIRSVAFGLPCHVVFTALDKKKTNEEGSLIWHRANIPGQEAELLPSSCAVVGYCEQLPSAPPQWRTHIQRYGAFDAGTRLRGMPPGIYPNFNFGEHIAPFLG